VPVPRRRKDVELDAGGGGRDDDENKIREAREGAAVGQIFEFGGGDVRCAGVEEHLPVWRQRPFRGNWVRSIEEMSASTRSWLLVPGRERRRRQAREHEEGEARRRGMQRQSERQGLIDEYVCRHKMSQGATRTW